jgi:adenine/guanine/hypoxanthine permease
MEKGKMKNATDIATTPVANTQTDESLKGLEKYFKIRQRGSTVRTELLAGISTFLSLAYIFVVNPAILSEAGMDKSVVFFATIVGSVVATLVMGLWAKLPFAVAPGLEMNAYVAYVVVGLMGFSWQGAMGAVFWSGVLTVLLNYTKVRVHIINAIPDKLKSGLAAAVGVFLMLIALKVSGLTTYEGIQIRGLGILTSPEAYVFYFGLIIAALLRSFNVKGAILISIIGASVLAHTLGIGQVIEPVRISADMLAGVFAFDLGVILDPRIWSVVLVLFILDFYGSIAKFIGLTRNTSIVDKDGNVPGLQEALTVDGGGTVLGASLGTSNLITYVESAVGIAEGGHTGLVAVVVAILMSLFLFLTPLVNLVPVVAATGALFWVGIMLFPGKKDLQEYNWVDIITVAVTILVTIWTFGLDKAMFAGFATYVVLLMLRGKWKDINIYLVISTLLLLLSIVLSA